MDLKPDSLEALGIILAFVFPGLLSQQVYRLVIPNEFGDWKEAGMKGFFYTVFNYTLLFPLAVWVLRPEHLEAHPALYWLAVGVLLFVGPACWPLAWKYVTTETRLAQHVQSPFRTPWDYYFDRRETAFMLIHLKSGRLIGGIFGAGSYAGSFPDHGDLYLSSACKITETGEFIERVSETGGILIGRDEYSYIELFRVPSKGVIK